MRLRMRMKDGTRFVGVLPGGGNDERQVLQIMQGQRVIAIFDDREKRPLIINTDAIAVVEIIREDSEPG